MKPKPYRSRIPAGYERRPDGNYERTAHFGTEAVTIVRDPGGRIVGTSVQDLKHTRPDDVTVADSILRLICDRYHVSIAELEGRNRVWRLVWPRWLAIALIHKHTRLSLVQIGFILNRDHTSIIHALNGIEQELQSNCARGREVAVLFQAAEQALATRDSVAA